MRSRSPLAPVRPGSPASTWWSLRVAMIRSPGPARGPSAIVTARPPETTPRAIKSPRVPREAGASGLFPGAADPARLGQPGVAELAREQGHAAAATDGLELTGVPGQE